MNRLLLYVIALVAAGFFVFSFISSNQQAVASKKYWEQKVPVIVAKADIEAGTILTEDMLKVDQWPRSWVKKGTTEWPKAVVGKVALYKLYKGVALVDLGASGNISEKTERLGLSYIVPSGQRAVSLPVSPQNMHSALIRPGDRVDVIITGGDLIYTGGPLIIQDVPVLAVVQDTNRNLSGIKPNVKYDPNFNSGDRKDTSTWTVTLAMSITDSQKSMIASSAKNAEVRLAIRVNGDHSTWDTKAVMKDIYKDEMSDKITVIKGSKSDIVYAPEQE